MINAIESHQPIVKYRVTDSAGSCSRTHDWLRMAIESQATKRQAKAYLKILSVAIKSSE